LISLVVAISQVAKIKNNGIPIELEKYFLGEQFRDIITHGVFNGTLRTGLVLPDLKDVSILCYFRRGQVIYL
jgi:hypothetical protein